MVKSTYSLFDHFMNNSMEYTIVKLDMTLKWNIQTVVKQCFSSPLNGIYKQWL